MVVKHMNVLSNVSFMYVLNNLRYHFQVLPLTHALSCPYKPILYTY